MKTEANKISTLIFALSLSFAAAGCGSPGDPAPTVNRNADNSRVTYVPQGNANGNANANVAVVRESSNGNTPEKKGELRTSTLAAAPAPDDSTFTSAMDNDGNFKEIREFTSHPRILRVERKLVGREERYTVFLRNGKSYPAPAEKMKNMRSLAPENILEAIGQPISATNPARTDPSQKKQP